MNTKEAKPGTAKNDKFSIYADYIPIAIAGNTSVYSSTDTSDYRTAIPYTMTEDGVINSISIYHNGDSASWHGHLAHAYEFMGWKPMTLKAVNSAAGWQTIELTNPIPVEEGQTIWLAWVFENNPGVRRTSGSPGNAVSSQVWAGL